MKMPRCTVKDESGAEQWSGSLHKFARDNCFTMPEARLYVTEPLRRGDRVAVGGGAAPLFSLALAA